VTETAAQSDEVLAPAARTPSRWRVGFGAAVVLVIVGVGVAVVSGLMHSGGGVQAVTAERPSEARAITPAATPSAARLMVHVLGQVKAAGVYELPSGARVIDAVGAAGGFTPAADRAALNLAEMVADGQQIYVPKPGEEPPAAAVGGSGTGAASTTTGAGAAAGGKIDLNSATLEQLETLPRVGPALGQRILDWRAQIGRFASVDDLKNVSGIGDKTFADLKELVTAG